MIDRICTLYNIYSEYTEKILKYTKWVMSYIIRVTGQPSVRPNVRIIRFQRVPFASFEYFSYVCNENYIIIVNECIVTDDTITICDVKYGKSCTPIDTVRKGKKLIRKTDYYNTHVKNWNTALQFSFLHFY